MKCYKHVPLLNLSIIILLKHRNHKLARKIEINIDKYKDDVTYKDIALSHIFLSVKLPEAFGYWAL